MPADASLKMEHAEVAYQGAAKGGEMCVSCKHFIGGKPPQCEIVKCPIKSSGWCEHYRDEDGGLSGLRINPSGREA